MALVINKFETNIYNLVVKTLSENNFLLAITEKDIAILANAFNNGEDRVMINGEGIFMKDPTMFKIYLINNDRFGTDASSIQKELRKYIKTTASNFGSIIDIIEEFGINVTNNFISGEYGALKTTHREFDFSKPITQKAKKFSANIKGYHFSNINQFVNQLNEEINIYDDKNTTLYLSHLNQGIIEELDKHKLVCKKNPCPLEESLIEYLGYINQELRKANSTNDSLYSEYFSPDEQINLDKKIDSILEYLNELQVGQQIIFEEIEDLRNLTSTLNKKNWKQVVKGKLVDMGLSKIIEKESVEFIYKTLTDESFGLLN